MAFYCKEHGWRFSEDNFTLRCKLCYNDYMDYEYGKGASKDIDKLAEYLDKTWEEYLRAADEYVIRMQKGYEEYIKGKK